MGIFKFKKGLEAKDKLTGFKGIIRYRVDYITGCAQYGLQPPVNLVGEIPKSDQFDEDMIEIIGPGLLSQKEYRKFLDKLAKEQDKQPEVNEEKKTGGPQPIVNTRR